MSASDLTTILFNMFNWAWSMATSFKIPGTNITPALAMVFLSVIGLGVRFIRGMLGLNFDAKSIRSDANTIRAHYKE